MLVQSQHNDSEKTQLLHLLAEMKKLRKDLGGYIEHYYHTEDTIVIKLTNGTLKIKEQFLNKYFSVDATPSDKDLAQLVQSFVNATFG